MTRRTTRARTSRRRAARLDFGALEIVGALLTPDIVTRIASFEASDQTEESYGVLPGLKMRDEIARYFRVAEALWHKFELAKDKNSAASQRFILEMLRECFGFDSIVSQKTTRKGEREFPIRHAALERRVPIVIAPVPDPNVRRTGIDESLEQFGDGSRKRSATLLLQEYLNAEDDALWGLCTDGLTLRLMRDNVSLTRPAWIEADLAKIFSEGLFPDFTALWLIIHQSRYGRPGTQPTDCALEHWRDAGRIEGTAAREKLRNGVEAALFELGQGFIEHPANAELRTALSEGRLSRQAYFEELLRLVYRLIFLFAAEDRELLHTPDATQDATRAYAQGYSVGRLRERCTRRTSWDKNVDVWEGLKATFRALSEGEPMLGLPALDGLFAQGQLSHLRESRIENRRLLAAIWRLAWLRPDGQPLTRVNWRDMETEELGSVYESLLELVPEVSATDKTFAFADADQGRGNARKTTASYYTPDSLVQALLDETLDPLIEETVAGKDDKAAIDALLNLRIIDPACGSGHFLLAAARRLASRIARLSSPGTPSQTEYRHWLREVARHTLFGVDKNPMAIELTKVALWIETVEPGKPLSFLDAHLRCGDSLLGIYDLSALQIGIPDDAYKPLTGDDKKAAAEWRKLNKQARERDDRTIELFGAKTDNLANAARKIEAQDEDDLVAVKAKQAAHAALLEGDEYWRVKTACDLYVAAFLMPKIEKPDPTSGAPGITVPTTSAVRAKLAGKLEISDLEANAVHMARAAGAFHWPLEFPQVFFSGGVRSPGFDLALGNPPWERIKLQEQEFFSARDPAVASAPNKAARQKLIDKLENASDGSAERRLFDEFSLTKRSAEAVVVFSRTPSQQGGRFPLTGTGDVNTYALFAELFTTAARRSGMVVPTGIATETTLSKFFSMLVTCSRLVSVFSFREIRRWFPGTDDRSPFCLLSTGTDHSKAQYAFGLNDVSEIRDSRRRFELSAPDVASINPNTNTAPVFQSRADAELVRQIYSNHSILIRSDDPEGSNAWQVHFIPGIHMSGASEAFKHANGLRSIGATRTGRNWMLCADDKTQSFLPLMESKMIHQFNHRWGTFEGLSERPTNSPLPRPSSANMQDEGYETDSWYWISDKEFERLANGRDYTWVLVWRDGARNGDERSLIASALPWGPIVGDLPAFGVRISHAHAAGMLAIINSLTLDYICRLKFTGAHIKQYHIRQLPFPKPALLTDNHLEFVQSRVLELTYTSDTMKPFAEDLGYFGAPFKWDEGRRALLRAELDAKIAKLYGLTRDQLRYILDPADVYGPDYPSETFRVLKDNDIKKYGEYRTAKLVLQAFDQLSAGTLSTEVVQLPSIKIEVPSESPTLVSPDGSWMRPREDARGETGAMLVAVLKALNGSQPARQVRLAAIMGLEPRLLLAHLSTGDATEWRRLVGDEAEPLPAGTVEFVPPTDQHWGAAVRQLRSSGLLVEDSSAGTWSPGERLGTVPTNGWPDGRAQFVLSALSNIDVSATDALPEELRRWIDAEAA